MGPTAPTEPPSPPDPPQDPTATTPPSNITIILHVARILLDYGRHLIDTVSHRAAAPNFNAIAACFGTANLSTILAHLNRGLLRAAALERFLPRTRTDETPPAPTDPQAEQQTDRPARPKARPRPSLPPGWDDPELFMPSPEDLDLQVRRRSLGRTFVEICSDLAVVPAFCIPAFWSDMFQLIHYFGGNVASMMREKARREQAFILEQDSKPGSTLDWLHLKRDEIRERLGFFIGEPPVDPFSAPPAALATGPP